VCVLREGMPLELCPGRTVCMLREGMALGLRPGRAVCVVHHVHSIVENASLKPLRLMGWSGEERVRVFYSCLAEIKL